MKYFCGIILLIGLISCQEQEPRKPSPRPLVISKDSNLMKADTANPYAPVDISPMDMSYYPENYPIEKMNGKVKEDPVARVIYSRPHRQGRKIFGNVVKYGDPWRLGANEASELELFREVTIQNKKIPKGEYIIYCVPHEDKWLIVFNSNLNSWGLRPDIKKNLFSFEVPVQTTTQIIEYFSMVFKKTNTGADLVMAWDNVVARLPLQF